MTSLHAAALPWGRGDLYTLVIANVMFALSCVLHRKALHARGADAQDILVSLMASSLTVGPLLMIVVDPLNKEWRALDVDLLDVVVSEARVTLWFAAFLALTNTLLGMLRPRVPPR